MTTASIDNVSDTAFWVAHYRAAETDRADALFRDPLAGRLAGERGRQIAKSMPAANYTSWAVVMRTCIIDDFIRTAIGEGVDTIVNLGAGLDTRPYRMDLGASLEWIEVDLPGVIDFKTSRLRGETPRCKLSFVPLDLADATARRSFLTGFNASSKKVLVLTEGVVPYLTESDVGHLADDLRALDHVAYWIVDYISPLAVKFRPRRMRRRLKNAPFRFEPADWRGFFAAHGWQCRDIRYLNEEASRTKRPLQISFLAQMRWAARWLLMSKGQRDEMTKMMGYALLVPGTPSAGA